MIVNTYEDVVLRTFEERDIPDKCRWINDPENNKYLHYDIPLEIEKTTQWFNNKNNNTRIDCVIEYNGIPVGVIGLLSIDKLNSKAEYYITVGEKTFKHKGIAYKATMAIIDFAFCKLKLHKVYLNVDAENIIAKKLYEKAGFVCEGHFSDDIFNQREQRFIDRERFAIISKN